MTLLRLWPIVFVVMTAQANSMRNEPGAECRPAVTTDQLHVPITCQGVDPQVFQPFNAVLATQDLPLRSTIRQAEAWVRAYHAVIQRLAEGSRDHDPVQKVYALVQAGKLVDAGALLDRVLAS